MRDETLQNDLEFHCGHLRQKSLRVSMAINKCDRLDHVGQLKAEIENDRINKKTNDRRGVCKCV